MTNLGQRAENVARKLAPASFTARQRPKTRNEEIQARKDADKIQSAIDFIGLLDPTGIADVVNMIGSLIRAKDEPDARRDHLKNAAISAIGAVPALGSMGFLGKKVKNLEAAAKAGQITSRPGFWGGTARTAGMVAARNPGWVVAALRGVINSLTVAFGRKGFLHTNEDRRRADVLDDMAQAGYGALDDIRERKGAVEGLKESATTGWKRIEARRRLRNIRAIRAARGPVELDGGLASTAAATKFDYGMWSIDTGSYPDPGASFAMRSSQSRGSRAMDFAKGVYRDSPAAWLTPIFRMFSQIFGPLTLARYAGMGPRAAGRLVGGGLKTAARMGWMGPVAAHVAGGWYFSPDNVTKVMRSLLEGATKATAATVTWTAALRVSNSAMLAYQQHLVPYSGVMGAAYSRYQADEMRRNVQMGRLTGGSYAGLSRSASALEDKTLPYRALGVNIANRMEQLFNTMQVHLISLAETAIPGLKESVDGLNWLLGDGGGSNLAPYQSLLHDIAKGKFTDKPTTRPR